MIRLNSVPSPSITVSSRRAKGPWSPAGEAEDPRGTGADHGIPWRGPSALSEAGHGEHARLMRVRDIMSTPVIGVTAEATIEEAAKLMMDRGFTTLPVFAAAGRLVGLVTEADLIRARFMTPGSTPEDGAIAGMPPRVVRQIMRCPAPAVPSGMELGELSAAMVESHQRCLPVVEDGTVVGMVSWRDLLTRFADWHIPAAGSP